MALKSIPVPISGPFRVFKNKRRPAAKTCGDQALLNRGGRFSLNARCPSGHEDLLWIFR